MEKETQEKIQQLQLMEQSLQNLLGQKQQFQSQMTDIESAVDEISRSKTCYKIVGGVMVEKSKENLTEELKNKREMMEIRIKSLEKQEESTREKAKKLQEEVLKEMKKEE